VKPTEYCRSSPPKVASPARAALYARTSTKDGRQHASNQLHKLREFAARMDWTIAVEITDTESGARDSRPGLDKLMELAARRQIDVVLVFDLSRLSRGGPSKTFDLIGRLDRSGVQFWSMTEEHFRTSGPAGALLIAIAAYIAKNERDQILARINAGIARARREGKTIGRPRTVIDRMKAVELREQGKSIREIAHELKTSKSTIERALI